MVGVESGTSRSVLVFINDDKESNEPRCLRWELEGKSFCRKGYWICCYGDWYRR